MSIPDAWDQVDALAGGSGSIIVVLATDAPLLPHQLDRLAQRAVIGIGRVGGGGEHSSGDLILAFSTANRDALQSSKIEQPPDAVAIAMLPDGAVSDLFWAAIEATEEAIAERARRCRDDDRPRRDHGARPPA